MLHVWLQLFRLLRGLDSAAGILVFVLIAVAVMVDDAVGDPGSAHVEDEEAVFVDLGIGEKDRMRQVDPVLADEAVSSDLDAIAAVGADPEGVFC